MKGSPTELYARFVARDPTANGQFVIGVRTTGIYCLPTCPARKPKLANVEFLPDEEAALAAGFRACKRCRPDHFYRDHDPDREAVERLLGQVRSEPARFTGVAELARASGVGRTKLTELFREHLHETPAGFLARERVRTVAERLATTETKPLDLAFEAGFESASAFHENFARQCALRPSEFRALTRGDAFRLRLPEDFLHARTLAILGRDGASPTEHVEGWCFQKALYLDGREARLEIELTPKAARCRVDGPRPLSPTGLAQAHGVAVRVLGLRCDPTGLERAVRRRRGLSRLTRGRRGLRVLLTADLYEALLWSIIGQQVNLPFAMALRARLVEECAARRPGRRAAGALVPHPTPAEVAALDYGELQAHQFSRRKAEYVIDLSRAIAGGELDLVALARTTATSASEHLLALRGIGPWSAGYVLMRGIGFADSLPLGDSGLLASLTSFFGLDERPDANRTRELMKPFRPHRSLACLHLWQRLNDES